MNGFIRRVLREQRGEEWKNAIIVADIPVESGQRKACFAILTAQGFAQGEGPLGVEIVRQEIASVKSKRFFQRHDPFALFFGHI